MSVPDWKWQNDAACRGQSLVLFFGMPAERGDLKDVREQKAKAICAECPVKAACLAHALSAPEKDGIWGGLDEKERKSERRRRMRHGIALTERPEMARFKRCRCCRRSKPVADFGPQPKNPDGLKHWCDPCREKARTPTWARSSEQGVA